MGLFDKLKKKPPQESGYEKAMRELETKQKEEETAKNAKDLAPETMNGLERSYHYKDVDIRVSWKYGGRYGGTLKDLRIKRGDQLRLVKTPTEDDADNVSVFWKKTEVGFMRGNRMRGMVAQWQDAGLPIFAAVNLVGEQHKLLAEIAFYGRVKKS